MRKKKIKILHVAQAAGGVDRYIRMLLKYLDKEKFENILVCSQDFNREDYDGLVDSFEQIEMNRAIGVSDLNSIKEVRRLIKKYNPDMPRLNLEIGRYINYSKLESMLSTQTLFFCNASRFDDEYEGEIPLEFFDGWAQQSEENYRRLNELKSHVYVPYVTCWTPYKTGNTKMWNEYASDNGVCIVSTVRQIFMLSRIQYQTILRNSGAQFIQNLIGTNPIIIVGCGGTMEDPNLSGFMSFAYEKLGTSDIPYFYLMKSGDTIKNNPNHFKSTLQKSAITHHSIQSINTPSNPSSTPLITPTLRSASGQGERPGSRTLRGSNTTR